MKIIQVNTHKLYIIKKWSNNKSFACWILKSCVLHISGTSLHWQIHFVCISQGAYLQFFLMNSIKSNLACKANILKTYSQYMSYIYILSHNYVIQVKATRHNELRLAVISHLTAMATRSCLSFSSAAAFSSSLRTLSMLFLFRTCQLKEKCVVLV